jgi:hypothetical protein
MVIHRLEKTSRYISGQEKTDATGADQIEKRGIVHSTDICIANRLTRPDHCQGTKMAVY